MEKFDAFTTPRTTADEVAKRLDEAFPGDAQSVEECSLENAGLDADAL